jgi:hypothetical protein
MIAQILMEARPVEVDGQHFIDVTVGNQQLKRQGPFASADEAKAKADALIRHWTPAALATTNDTMVLHGKPAKLDSDVGRKFVADATRAAEGLIDDKDLQEKYELTAKNLKEMAKNPALVKAIRDERERRMRNGTAARESASRHFVRSPNVMSAIMDDTSANPRHRIEAAREIRATATSGGEESTDAGEVFHIVINLGADEKFEKEVALKQPQPPMIEGKTDVEE